MGSSAATVNTRLPNGATFTASAASAANSSRFASRPRNSAPGQTPGAAHTPEHRRRTDHIQKRVLVGLQFVVLPVAVKWLIRRREQLRGKLLPR